MKRLCNSFTYAVAGIRQLVHEEFNSKLVGLAGLFVIFLIVVFPLRQWEVVILLILVFAVWVLEILNSILERMADMLKPRLHSGIKAVKDMMAGVVLLSSLGALIIGLIIFIPYIVHGTLRW